MIEVLDASYTALNNYLECKKPSLLLILTDENTHNHCLPFFLSNVKTDIPFEIIELEAGEEMKTLESAGALLEIFSEFQADRSALVINLGGGVISDLGGFVASIYKRGIPFINVPTSLLGMCDASIGGKTGVDILQLKNLAGTFALPEKIFLDTTFLNTLPERELRSGFAEMLKHGLVADQSHWENLIKINTITSEQLAPCISDSMQIKRKITEQDFTEKNVRKILNFGHTIGHAVESSFLKAGAPITHGEAIAIGMICETHLAFLKDFLSKEAAVSIILVLERYFPKIELPFDNENLLQLMQNDKKNENSQIMFSLLTDLGKCSFDIACSEAQIVKAISFYKIK